MPWENDAALAVLPKLHSLCLDYRQRHEPEGSWRQADILVVSRTVPATLVPATCLTHLMLHVKWSGDMPALCSSLAALQELRWGH